MLYCVHNPLVVLNVYITSHIIGLNKNKTMDLLLWYLESLKDNVIDVEKLAIRSPNVVFAHLTLLRQQTLLVILKDTSKRKVLNLRSIYILLMLLLKLYLVQVVLMLLTWLNKLLSLPKLYRLLQKMTEATTVLEAYQ